MERSFIVSKESIYFKDYKKYCDLTEEQRKFIVKFFEEKGVEAEKYYVGGNGFVNCPFNDFSKTSIRLSIMPTENDLIKFGKMLKKPDKHNLYGFKKNSAIAKEFAQNCIDGQIVINLWQPRVGDYFKSVGFCGCSRQQFTYNDEMYIKIESEYLKEDDTPEGFKEIKLSGYHSVLEQLERKSKEDGANK